MTSIKKAGFHFGKPAFLFLFVKLSLFLWNYHPQDEVDQQPRDTTRNECDHQCQAEPERTNTIEFGKSAADAGDNAVTPRSSQGWFLLCCHY